MGRDVTMSLSGTVCRPSLGLAMINPHSKFEVSVFSVHSLQTTNI